MLVLSRKEQEQILIGNGISISVVRIRGNRVQLGIVAADNIRIQRVDSRDEGSEDIETADSEHQLIAID